MRRALLLDRHLGEHARAVGGEAAHGPRDRRLPDARARRGVVGAEGDARAHRRRAAHHHPPAGEDHPGQPPDAEVGRVEGGQRRAGAQVVGLDLLLAERGVVVRLVREVHRARRCGHGGQEAPARRGHGRVERGRAPGAQVDGREAAPPLPGDRRDAAEDERAPDPQLRDSQRPAHADDRPGAARPFERAPGARVRARRLGGLGRRG